MEAINKCLDLVILTSIKEVAAKNQLLYCAIVSDSLDNNERAVKCKKFANLVNDVLKREEFNIKLDSDFIIDTCKKNKEIINMYLLKINIDRLGYKF